MIKIKIVGIILLSILIIVNVISLGAIFLLSEIGGTDVDHLDEAYNVSENSLEPDESDDDVDDSEDFTQVE